MVCVCIVCVVYVRYGLFEYVCGISVCVAVRCMACVVYVVCRVCRLYMCGL